MWKFKRNKDKYRVTNYSDFDTRRLITDVQVCNPSSGMCLTVRGLWDTGGKISTISRAVIETLDLLPNPLMKMRVHTSGGIHDSNVYPIALLFGNDEVTCNATMCERIMGNVDIIIGMDVITKGDLSITNAGGRTEMIFRLPTQGHISK